MKVKVLGLKYFVGEVDGKMIKSGKLFAECKLDSSRNDTDKQWAQGIFTEEFKVPPEIVKRCIHVPLPFFADLDIERVGNGRETRELVIDVRPLERADKPVAAVAKAA